MTTFSLGTITIDTLLEEDVDKISVTGHATDAFLASSTSSTWPSDLSGSLDEDPIVTTLAATSIAALGVILNANADPRGLAGTVFFEYGTAVDTSGQPVFGHQTSGLPLVAAYGDQFVSQPLVGLTANTFYYARAVAVNANGKTPGNFVTFQTSVDAGVSGPPISSTDLQVVGFPTQTAITLTASWDMNGAAGLIHIERLIGPTWVDIVPPQAAPIGVQTMTATATGLTAGTTYTFRSRATNPNAPEPTGVTGGNISSTTAPPDPTLPVATLLTPGAAALTSITVNGRISQLIEVPVRWQFQYGLTLAYGSTTPLQIDSALPPGGTEDVSALISGLSPATLYHYRLVAMRIDNAGGNQFSIDGTFTTATPPPSVPVPTLTAIGALTSSSAVVNGRVDNIVDVPAKWQFEYGLTAGYGSTTTLVTDPVIPPGGGEAVQATISGLAASTLYHYRLTATRTDDAGGAQHSVDGTFTTTAAVAAILPVPGTLIASSIGQTSAQLNGRVAQVTSQSGVSYHFEYGTTTSYGTSTSTSSLASSGSTTVSALVSGSVDPQNLATQVFIDYGTDPDNLNQTLSYGQIVGTGQKAFSAVVGGLNPNAIYYFRARAVNSGGTSISTMRPTRGRMLTAAPGTTVHVSTTGNNTTGDGTAALPWKTIQKAAGTAGVGTILMHTGQYVGQAITARPSTLVTIKDAGDGPVELDFVTVTAPAGNLNFEGDIKATGYSRPDLGSTLIFQGTGDGSGTKAGPVYWAAGNITAIGKVGTSGNAPVCCRASADADNFYFDGTQFQGGGFAGKSFTNATPATSFPTGWRFVGCNFGPDNTWDVNHLGGAKNWRYIACTFHDPKSLGGYIFANTAEEHHDGFGQIQYADDVKFIGGRTYDHTNPAVTSPGSALLLNADIAGAVISNIMVIGHVIENWSGGGLNVVVGGPMKFLQTTIGAVTGTGDGVHPASAGSTADISINAAPTGITFRGVLAREQFVDAGAATFTANDRNLWRTSASRAGTNAKSGAVSFVSASDLHLSTTAQAAATGGPVPTDDPDLLLWDNDGRGYGADPAIGAYASPAVTSPLFAGMVTVTPLVPEAFDVAAIPTGLTASTTYHYRLVAVRADGSGGNQFSSDDTFTTQSATLVTTSASYGPATPVAPTSTVAGGTFVVKSDGKIYDSTGTTLQDMTSKTFSSLVTIKSDTAGTRRTLNAGLINNSRFGAGLVLTEVVGNDPTSNWEVKDPSTTYGIDMQGCSGRFGHARIVNFAHNGIRLTASAAGITCGATGSTWDTSAPDLRIDNFTAHAAVGADGAAIVAAKARNVVFGGIDPGTQSSPTGLSNPAFLFDGAVADDVQDVRVGVALDGTTSYLGSKSGTYTFHLIDQRRSGWEGALDNPVLFTNTTGNRPEKPVWLGVSGVSPGSETSINTTNLLVTTDYPCVRNGVSQNLVTYTFRNGATGNQSFEVDSTVWDPAVSLGLWSDTATRFVDGRDPLGARVAGSATVIANKATIDSTFTVSGGAAGSAARAGDGWFEIRGVKFDPGTPSAQIWTGTNVFTTDTKNGAQLKVAPAASQAGGVMPTIPVWNGSPGGGVDLKVTNADGSTPAVFTKWAVPHGTDVDPTKIEWISGIYTNHIDDLLGANAVETGVGYRRQLGYEGYDAANSKFTGVHLIPGPSGGAINPEGGEVLTVSAATPGVVTTYFPHGLATNDWVTIAGNTQAAANGTFKVTRITNTTFSLQTTAGVNVAIPTAGTGGTFTPLGPGGTGYTYGLVGSRSSGFQLVAGETLDSTMAGNYNQPVHNASFNVGSDATGIRFIGCDFYDVSIQALASTSKTQIIDCVETVSSLYGKGIGYNTVDNGVVGTYDSNNQHDPPKMLGGLNVIAPTEAFWLLERFTVKNAHGDIAPGKFAAGSVMRHCRWHHGSDARNASVGNSQDRDGVAPALNPKCDAGPHGDLYQNYDRISIVVIGCDLHTNAHSIWFSRAQAGTNYHIATGVALTNSGGVYLGTSTAHGAKAGDKVLITGTGDGTLDNHEFVITATTKDTFTLGTTTFVANRTATVTFVVHYFVDFRRNDIRTTKHWDHTDLTDSTHIKNKGAVSFQQTEAWVANTVTMQAKFYDNRWDTVDGAAGSWQLKTALAGTTFDLGTPNRNLARTYGLNNGFVPGGVITPIYS